MGTEKTQLNTPGVCTMTALIVLLFYPWAAAAQNNTDPKTAAQQEANRDFLGIRFGIAFGLSATVKADDRVEEAEVVDGVVRITKMANHRTRVMLETHYFWQWKAEEVPINVEGGSQIIKVADIGIGPFAAIQTSGDEVLEAIGMGLMVGFKRDARSSFNVGGGILLDPTVKTLGDGIRPNEPLPPGETVIRFKEEPRWGLLVLTSFSF